MSYNYHTIEGTDLNTSSVKFVLVIVPNFDHSKDYVVVYHSIFNLHFNDM